jgi:hypothetical protein
MKYAAPIAFAAIFALAACGPVEVESLWRTGPIAIDGTIADWSDHLVEVEGTGLSLGVANDADFVYVGLAATDARAAAQAFGRGLYLWLDPKGGSDKVLGIHYPRGVNFENFPGPPEPDSMGVLRKSGRTTEEETEVEILGPGRDQKTELNRGELKGIEVAASRRGGFFVYEIKVPLAKSEAVPFAAESGPGKTVGIGFDTAGPDILMPGRGMGGMGPAIGGRSFGRGGMGRPGGRASLKLWLKVRLAPAPTGN